MRHNLSIPSSLKFLNEVETFIHEVMDHYHVPSPLQGYFMLTVCESVNNAISHGNKSDFNKIVNIEVQKNNDELSIFVEDEGSGFDYSNLPDPTSRDFIMNERGRGLFLVKNLADDVEFLNNGSKIKIKFNLKSESEFLFRED